MKNLFLLFAFSGAIIFTACSKKEVPVVPPAGPTCTLTKITNPDNSYSVITRNAAGKYLTLKTYPPSGSYSSYLQYGYSGDRLSKLEGFNGANQTQGYNTYEKTTYGELVRQYIPAGGIFIENGQWEYHMSAARINKVITKTNNSGTYVPTREDVYTFDGNGNVTKVVSTNLQNSSSATTTYTYDSKKKPYAGDFGPDPRIQSTNNITSVTSSSGTESYIITYNNTGYAATRSTVGNGKSTYLFTYTGCD